MPILMFKINLSARRTDQRPGDKGHMIRGLTRSCPCVWSLSVQTGVYRYAHAYKSAPDALTM